MRCLKFLCFAVQFFAAASAWACPVGSVCETYPAYTNAAPSVTIPAPTDRIPYVQGAATKFLSPSAAVFGDLPPSVLTADGANVTALTSNSYTAEQIADWVFCNCTNTPVSTDAIRGVAQLVPGSTIDLALGVAGYAVADQAKGVGSFPVAVAVFGAAVANVDNSDVWGINTVLSDHAGQVISSGIGRNLYNEFDLNFTSPNSTGIGVAVEGASLVQPAFVIGFDCGPLGTGIKWNACYTTAGGVTQTALNFGAQAASGSSIPGQLETLDYFDGSGVDQNITMYAFSGSLHLEGTANASISMDSPGDIFLPYSPSTGYGLYSQNNSHGPGVSVLVVLNNADIFIGQAGTVTSVVAGLNLSAVSGAGSASQYVCADSSGFVVVQSGAC